MGWAQAWFYLLAEVGNGAHAESRPSQAIQNAPVLPCTRTVAVESRAESVLMPWSAPSIDRDSSGGMPSLASS